MLERRTQFRTHLAAPTYADLSCYNTASNPFPQPCNRCLRVRNISSLGAFIEDAHPMSPGCRVELVLWLNEYEPLGIKGIVRRVVENRGMGVEFTFIDEADNKRLNWYLAQGKKQAA